jgi:uncharacterized protein (TIGR02246 family)
MRLLIACLTTLLLGANLHGADMQEDDNGVQAYLDDWIAAWNAHDVDSLMHLHADDCITVNRFGKMLVGRDETERHVKMLHTQIFKSQHFPSFRILHQRALSSDFVVLQAGWQNPSLQPPPAPPMNDMVVTFLLKRSGASWVAEEVDLHNVEASPPAKPAKPAAKPASAPTPKKRTR